MTTRQVINKLIKEGHKVTYYTRKDGGVRITSIDSQRFTGSTGNTRARALTGESLSERRKVQLSRSYMKTEKGQWGHPKSKKEPLPDEAKRLIRKAQRVFRKQGVIAGTSSTYRFRQNVEMFGYDEAIRRLNQNIRYAQGLAYEENIEAFCLTLEDDYNKLSDKGESEAYNLRILIDKIRANKSSIRESDLAEAIEIHYNMIHKVITLHDMITQITIKLKL